MSGGSNDEGKRNAKQSITLTVEPVKLYRQPFVAPSQAIVRQVWLCVYVYASEQSSLWFLRLVQLHLTLLLVRC